MHFLITEDHLKIAILEKIEEIDRRLAPITSGTRPKIHVKNLLLKKLTLTITPMTSYHSAYLIRVRSVHINWANN